MVQSSSCRGICLSLIITLTFLSTYLFSSSRNFSILRYVSFVFFLLTSLSRLLSWFSQTSLMDWKMSIFLQMFLVSLTQYCALLFQLYVQPFSSKMSANSYSVFWVFSSSASKMRLSYLVRMGTRRSLVSLEDQGSSLRNLKIFLLSTTSLATQSMVYSMASISSFLLASSEKMVCLMFFLEANSSSPGISSTEMLTLVSWTLSGVDVQKAMERVTECGEILDSMSCLPVRNLVVADFPEPLLPMMRKVQFSNMGVSNEGKIHYRSITSQIKEWQQSEFFLFRVMTSLTP